MSEDVDFMAVNVEDAVELQLVQTGWKGELEIAVVTPNPEKKFVRVLLSIPGEEFTRKVSHMLWFPKDDDTPDQVNKSKLNIKQFFEAFGINGDDRRDPDDWIGLTAKATLKIKSNKDPQYGDENVVTKWL